MAPRTLCLSIALVTVLLAGRAHSVTRTWIGSDGGSFSTPANWDPGGTPGAADTLIFANGAVGSTYDINFDEDSTATQLTVATNPLAFAGASHTLSVTNTLVIGLTGMGTGNASLTTSLAEVKTTYAGLGRDFGNSGTLNVSAGTFTVTGTAASTDLIIGNSGTGAINVTSGADVVVAGDTRLAYFGAAVGNLSVIGSGSTWTSTGFVAFAKGTGTITVAGGGALSASSISLGFGGCTLEGNGTVTAPVVNMHGTVSPSSLTSSFGELRIVGAYTQGANGKLRIEINGIGDGTFDRLNVSDAANLAGTLEVALASFTPTQNDVFDILDFTSRLGTFATLTLPVLTGSLEWDISKLYTDGTIRVVLPGDFDNSGVVDAADYGVWRKGLGTTYAAADFDVWRTHFGRTAAGSGTSLIGTTSVPEPLSLWMPAVVAMLSARTFSRKAFAPGRS